ncbi:immune inhibitor A domain-containing protein, partial [Bacillus thuringiensis]|uniref:immune inhibitor A domain-containing protein n=1 Tax=Bacillus thuringiensis TaxID=1428 RepID=UPI003D6D3A0B
MLIHPPLAQEAPPAKLAHHAISPHPSKLPLHPLPIQPTKSNLQYFRPKLPPHHYTIQPQHGPVPLFPHQFPHHLPLPNQYDTKYTPNPSPLQPSSLM